MFEELKFIELSGEKYPVKCDLVVLEKIQDEFGSLNEFEKKIYPWNPVLDEAGEKIRDENGNVETEFQMPDIPTVNTALFFMVNEGEEIAAEREGREPRSYSRNEIVRKVDISPVSLALKLHTEYYRCFELKNEKTTQDQKNQKEAADS
ncbi:hypothetical protein AALC16_22060 [Lachnospiraceae bacterium 29-91]